ncbi:CCN_G0047300.mRNA.1.CDS.1 [Saccharomyces cerevisiae]|nr:HLJ1_G0036360.mRNA.1.CDS.1 [Saccharomyces cerevisiae]CAI4750938.1 CCN_G0047300.mRNA.1.CDS.1 [Saccharomyces cerevisiae]CAI7449637.1 CCN_G0047300.mRNA.1.CDS.1 [Saccharomyces cerevisiae]
MGLFEGGFVADLVLWMSYFYSSSELSIRLSFFWVTLSLTQIITSIVAFGVFHMRGIGGMAGWQWLFLIEGIFTLVIGISAYFLMVPSVVQTKKPWSKKGWFTEREEKIIVNKILRDDSTKGDMNNRQGMSLKMLWQGITDYYIWPIYLMGLLAYIPTNVLTTYLTLVLRSIGFTTFQANLLAIPNFVLHILLLLGLTWLTEKCNNRLGLSLLQPLYTVPLLAVLRFWKGTMFNKWGTYAIITLILDNPYIHAICVSLCSRNSQSVKTRTVSTCLYNMFVQVGLIISSNIYAKSDAPLYRKGNGVLFGLALFMFPILIGSKLIYVYINKQRDKRWNAMS